MKFMMFTAALMLSGAAIAQTTTDTTTTDTSTTSDPAAPAPMASDPAMTDATAAPMAGPAGGGMTVAPDNSNPERDARGVAVVSASATAPAGWNVPAGAPGAAGPSATAPSMGSAGQLPPCTRTVTDHCTQTYERGSRPRR